jgi:hypothetical protein
MKALQRSAVRVQDLVLDRANGLSSLAVALSSAAELLEDRIDVVTANGIHRGIRSALGAALSHFSELGLELELLGYGCNVDLTEDQVDAVWTQVRQALDSLVSFVPPSAACGSPNGAGVE